MDYPMSTRGIPPNIFMSTAGTRENMRDSVYPDYEWDNAFIPVQVNLFRKSGV